MNIIYLTKANLAFSRSHIFNILKTSEAMGKALGERVVVIAPKARTKDGILSERDILSKHTIDNNFVKIVEWGSDDHRKFEDEADIIYWRDFTLYLSVRKLRKKGKYLVLEVHRTARKIWEKILWPLNLKLADAVITITGSLKERLKKYNPDTYVVYGNAHEPSLFDTLRDLSKDDIRKRLSLPAEDILITYTGQTKNYNFGEVFKAIKNLPVKIMIVGVTNKRELEAVARENGALGKVILMERVERREAPTYIMASDILFVPYVREEAGAFPVKIFEYMGSGRPIVSFSNEPIREILKSGVNSLLVDPPTSDNWERAFRKVLSDNEFSDSISKNALEESINYNWQNRGEIIVGIIREYV